MKRPGLPNYGNTCYLNSVIQALYSCSSFKHEIAKISKLFSSNRSNFKLNLKLILAFDVIHHLSILLTNMEHGNTNGLKQFTCSVMRMKRKFSVHSQQDAQEFLLYLLEAVDDCREYLKCKLNCELISPFNASSVQKIVCQNCKNVSLRDQRFNILTIPLNPNYNEQSEKYGSWSLTRWANVEQLKGENKYSCSHCASKQNAFMYPWIKEQPEHLILHLCRFGIATSRGYSKHGNFGFIKKIKGSFPIPYFIPVSHHYFHGKYYDNEYYNRLLKYTEDVDSIKAQYTDEKFVSQQFLGYYLYAMVIHIGNSIGSGHYVMANRMRSDNPLNWKVYDDASTYTIDVLNLYRNQKYSPYLLFYELLN
uniref:Ubiquitin carboxyl-terminal hydrolase 46 (inferred by orthology to a human protein) n=1 Tax=Strongyloides venezuelensis TaxID=75913 RepID=A0A0K0FGD7_STRVS